MNRVSEECLQAALPFPVLAKRQQPSLVGSISGQGAVCGLNTHCVSSAVAGKIETTLKECQSLGGSAGTARRREQDGVMFPLNTVSKNCTLQ